MTFLNSVLLFDTHWVKIRRYISKTLISIYLFIYLSHAMRKGAFWAYNNSKAPDQPVILIRDFGIPIRSTLSKDSVSGQRRAVAQTDLGIRFICLSWGSTPLSITLSLGHFMTPVDVMMGKYAIFVCLLKAVSCWHCDRILRSVVLYWHRCDHS